MDKTAHRGTGDEAQNPEDNKNNCNCVEHIFSLLMLNILRRDWEVFIQRFLLPSMVSKSDQANDFRREKAIWAVPYSIKRAEGVAFQWN